jgi:Ni/Co efflux regulator RcnB
MKSLLLTTAAFVASLIAAPVLAQPDQPHGDHGGGPPGAGGGEHHGGGAPQGGGAHGPAGAPHQAGGPQHGGAPVSGGAPHPVTAGPAPQVHTEARPAVVGNSGGHDDHQRGGGDNRQGGTGNNPGAGRDVHQDRNGPGPANQGGNGHGPSRGQPFARGSATAHGSHFNFQGRNFSRAHAPTFRYPQGYGYRRWGVGARLPRLFLSPAYFYTDYSAFGFGPPPYGDQWVRYGQDLLLVDMESGEVEYVIYGAFY